MNWLLSSLICAITFCTPYEDAQQPLQYLLQTAQKQCLVAMYTLTNSMLVDELIDLHAKGVDVEVILDKSQSVGKYEAIQIIRMQTVGIPVFIGESMYHQIMHNKFVEIDDSSSADGSYNWTESANHQDNILHIDHDPKLAEQLHNYWNEIKADLQ